MIRAFENKHPQVHPTAFVEDSAQVVGDVRLGESASVWYGAVVRGDIQRIEIGDRSNVQDLSVLHVTADHPVLIESDVTLGHRVVVHGATIRAGALIGIGAVVLDGAEIGAEALVAAGAVVTPGTKVPARTLIAGVPGKVVRSLETGEIERLRTPARNYVDYTARYRREYGR